MTRSLLPSNFDQDKKNRPWFQSLHSEIDRVFDEFKKSFPDFGERIEVQNGGNLTPKIDVSESEKAIEVSAELPGISEDNVDVTITDNVLVIKGEKSEEHEKKDKNYHLVERSHGSYLRSIPLGFEVDESKVQATFKDGVLNIKIAKPKEIAEKTKKIPISNSA